AGTTKIGVSSARFRMSFRARGGAREISLRDTWHREWLPPQPPTSSSPCGATPRRVAGLLRRAAAIHRVGWTACHRRELYRARGAPRQQAIRADGNGRPRQRQHLVAAACSVAGVYQNWQVAAALDRRDDGEVERIAGEIGERAHAAFAQDNLIVSLGQDVLGGHQELVER